MGDSDTCLSRFTSQARARGSEPAVCTGASAIGFAELDDRAERVAAALTANGVRPGDPVCILVPRSADFLTGLLAAWKVGAAFVPLDPAQPDARLSTILADTGSQVLITDGSTAALRPQLVASRCLVDVADTGEYVRIGVDRHLPSAHDLAYVLYTSGSTGRPKGVMVRHAALTRYVEWIQDVLPVAGAVSSLCHTSVGFDFTYSGLLLSLTTGGRVVMPPPEWRLDELGELIGIAGVDLVRLTPSHVDVLATAGPATAPRGPGVFLVGGERLTARHVRVLRSLFPDAVVHNHYGPTEAVIGRSTFRVSPAGQLSVDELTDEDTVPIGVR